eukprot:TRINITY_DN2574_c0_g1_i1.p1 TRINITY_DN2574_c0_g1~~TRINITY_DN2574_c0_g1_i1.p1  ORF type:complete len:347 (-),score=84.65 TRINITY_DN2574_c0_g1_i1:136-1176(-)
MSAAGRAAECYDIFIAHGHEKTFVRSVHDHVTRETALRVFLDTDEAAGRAVGGPETFGELVRNARVVYVFVNEFFVVSQYCMAELDAALDPSRPPRSVVPVFLDERLSLGFIVESSAQELVDHMDAVPWGGVVHKREEWARLDKEEKLIRCEQIKALTALGGVTPITCPGGGTADEVATHMMRHLESFGVNLHPVDEAVLAKIRSEVAEYTEMARILSACTIDTAGRLSKWKWVWDGTVRYPSASDPSHLLEAAAGGRQSQGGARQHAMERALSDQGIPWPIPPRLDETELHRCPAKLTAWLLSVRAKARAAFEHKKENGSAESAFQELSCILASAPNLQPGLHDV